MTKINRLGRVVVQAACVSELVGMHTDRWPTFTSLAHRHRNSTVGKVALAGVVGLMTYHLCLEAVAQLVEEAVEEKVST